MPTVKVPLSHIFSDRKYSKQYIHVILVSYHYGSNTKTRQIWGIDSCDRPSIISNWTQIVNFSASVVVKFDGWPRKNNRAPLVFYIKLCASFQIHPWSQTWVTIRKPSIGVKIGDFFVLCNLEIWRMTSKNNRAPLLYHIKLCIISKPSVNLNWSYSPETLNSGQNRRFFFVLCDLEIWRMTLKNNRTPLLCCFKVCASFHSHW